VSMVIEKGTPIMIKKKRLIWTLSQIQARN
jgi:hypothetical protein